MRRKSIDRSRETGKEQRESMWAEMINHRTGITGAHKRGESYFGGRFALFLYLLPTLISRNNRVGFRIEAAWLPVYRGKERLQAHTWVLNTLSAPEMSILFLLL